MRCQVALLLPVLLAVPYLAAGSPVQEVDTAIELPDICGDWTLVGTVEDGHLKPLVRQVCISAKVMEVRTPEFAWTVKLIWLGQGKLDLVRKSGERYPAIYKRRGDQLRICADLLGRERPTDFTSKIGSKRALLILEQKKPE